MIVDIDAGDDIGARAEARAVALDDPLAQSVDGLRNINRVALILHGLEGSMQGLVDAEKRSRARRAGVGRKVEQHDGHLALRALGDSQTHEALDPVREAGDPLPMGLDVARRPVERVA